MPTNKELEKRVNVLEGMVESMQKMLATVGGQHETTKEVVDNLAGLAGKIDKVLDAATREATPIVFTWDGERKLWHTSFLLDSEIVLVSHDSPAQALQMLLQKLQQRVS